jgi:cystathionine beta-lyase/cystathionine gamma-synthase
MNNRMQTVLTRQFYCRLPRRPRELRPMRLRAAKHIKSLLQLRDWLRDGECVSVVHYQPTLETDRT